MRAGERGGPAPCGRVRPGCRHGRALCGSRRHGPQLGKRAREGGGTGICPRPQRGSGWQSGFTPWGLAAPGQVSVARGHRRPCICVPHNNAGRPDGLAPGSMIMPVFFTSPGTPWATWLARTSWSQGRCSSKQSVGATAALGRGPWGIVLKPPGHLAHSHVPPCVTPLWARGSTTSSPHRRSWLRLQTTLCTGGAIALCSLAPCIASLTVVDGGPHVLGG